MQLFLALEQIDATFRSVQFKHLSISDPERLPRKNATLHPRRRQDAGMQVSTDIRNVPMLTTLEVSSFLSK